jgi:acetyl esterase/lipase
MVLSVHGGGWGGGDKRKKITLFFEPLARTDFTWFSINYRLAPTNHWPACLEDVQTAIRWAKAHAKEYKGDPQRLALMGYSAGGELVCLAAVTAREDARVQAVVGFSPPTDLVTEIERRGGLSSSLKALFGHDAVDDQTRPLLKEMSAGYFVKPGLPPFLLIQGDADKSVPYDLTAKFQEKLKENNVPCELVTVKGAPHRIADWDKFDPSYKEKLMAWLDRTLGVAAANPASAQAVKPDITVASDGSADFKTIRGSSRFTARTAKVRGSNSRKEPMISPTTRMILGARSSTSTAAIA